jgi:hypothetical protein
MLILGVASVAACVVTLMWWKVPAASGQEETVPNEESFVVRCEYTRSLQEDPIVDFGETYPPGSDHEHAFFGNTTTNANSTYDTLRAGGTTCDDPNDTAAYWIPTVKWIDSTSTIDEPPSCPGKDSFTTGWVASPPTFLCRPTGTG